MIGFSPLNPLRFRFDPEYRFDHNRPFCYQQKWQKGDTITLQVLSDAPVHLDLRDQRTLSLLQSYPGIEIPNSIANQETLISNESLFVEGEQIQSDGTYTVNANFIRSGKTPINSALPLRRTRSSNGAVNLVFFDSSGNFLSVVNPPDLDATINPPVGAAFAESNVSNTPGTWPADIEAFGFYQLAASFRVYEFTITDMPYEGIFYFDLRSDNMTTRYFSNPFSWKEVQEDTILLQYRNTFNDFDMIFETGIELQFRVEGTVQLFTPRSDSVVYFNQRKNPSQLSATPYRTWSLIIGTGRGVPDWVLDLCNFIMATDTKKVDRLQFERNEGADWEVQRVDNYPLSSASIEIVQKFPEWMDGWHHDLTVLGDSEDNAVLLNNFLTLQR